MNRVLLRSGRALDEAHLADNAIPALVSPAFAEARGLQPGSRVGALINGKRRTLVIVGIALSPEFIFAGLMGMPDLRGFGVFWVDRATRWPRPTTWTVPSTALRSSSAPGASERAVIDALDPAARALRRPRGARPRRPAARTRMLDNEIKEQRVLGTVLPSIFLGVAAFLLNVVVSRLVATQREQIAALKALGYPNRAIGAHYLKLVLVIVLLGLVLGVAARRPAGHGLHRPVRRVLPLPAVSSTASSPGCWSSASASRWPPPCSAP